MKPQNYNQLVFDKRAKNIRWRNSSLFNKNCWESWLAVCIKLKLDPCISPYTKINSKWIKDLNIRPQTLKLIQERIGNTLELVGIDKNFLNETPAAQQLRDSIDKWDLIKLKSFCSTKEMVSKLKRTPTEWEKIFANYTSDKGLITRMYRELKKLNSPKTNEPIKKWASELNRTFSKEEIQMAKKHMKKCPYSFFCLIFSIPWLSCYHALTMAFFPQNTATVPVACSSGKSLFLPAEDYTGLLQEFP
jgi:hypothetical protein